MKTILKLGIITFAAGLMGCGGGGGGSNPHTTPVSAPYNAVYDGECKANPTAPQCSFEAGYNAGYNSGYDEGFDEGYDSGFSSGESSGYHDGYDDAYDRGYSDGYDDGQWYSSADADDATDTNFTAGRSEANKAMVKRAAKGLVAQYGLPQEKAMAIASALNVWKMSGVERGYTTPRDISTTFTKVFGVELKDALAAVKALSQGETSGMRDITNRSASTLGIKPHQAKNFIKGMYRQALTDAGYDADSIDW